MPQLAALLAPPPTATRAEAPDAGTPAALSVRLTVNGEPIEAQVRPRVTLLDWLREERGLTGAKKGCNEGACGACTVLLDGQRVNACLTLVVQCEGSFVTTIEGIAPGDAPLHPVQQAFIDRDALQCGYCTPGQVLSAIACIAEGHAGDADSVREWMSGNLCRCACYPQIVEAVLDAAQRMASAGATEKEA
jgi:xanthine dehydrogenase YagT iron-sulfur-binding subunit